MGVSTFNGLNIALRGLTAQQRALDVTSHNIANVEAPGYSRQEAVMGAAPTLTIPAGANQLGQGAQLGQGVDVVTYRRLRDDFLDLQWRAQNMSGGQAEVGAQRLAQVQTTLGSGSSSDLGAQLDTFWSAWQTLSSNPQSDAAKANVVGTAQTVAAGFQRLDTDLATLGAQATTAVSDLLGSQGPIRPIADELAKLNTQINQATAAGVAHNDLLDRRDLLLDNLSRYGQVSVTPDPTLDGSGNPAYPGMIQVSFGGASTPLVSQTTVTMPTAATLSATPGGTLGGLQDVAAKIASYRTTLNGVAGSVIGAVNGLSSTPIFSGTGSADIAVVATSTTVSAGASGGPAGDNSVATAIAALRGGTVDRGYAGLVQSIGADTANADADLDTTTRVLGSLTEQRQSTSGVSMDEEMANMVRFQRGYQAAARALTTMDDMLNTLINSTGRVGL
ncbi:flagellar hook-associated protein FlgK [Baekduia soli]|uniref:Flagellar hook-associated protein 1 n=1 Tax=Baekduia soli TaxID=496014 RepID=A0A5B8U1K1_9ACTN|nr:flagellar hook-associated protein FlgK [Baekduia soli]QEC46820.1 flagellar hook-associated protein FlgK [Baekduia soli]